MTPLPKYHIALSPIGEFDDALVKTLRREVLRVFDYPMEIVPLMSAVDFAFDSERKQYHSTPILEKLDLAAPDNAIRVLALTKVDLFIPILTHVYGEAQLGGKACIVSIHRLNEDLSAGTEKTFQLRVAKEAIHELGHTFNLRHCKDPTCIMHYCRSIKDVDQKLDRLCRYCSVLLDDEYKRMEDGQDRKNAPVNRSQPSSGMLP